MKSCCLAPLILLSACAQSSEGFPSLAPRAIESRANGAPIDTPAPALTAAEPALVATIARLRTQAEAGQSSFAGLLGPATTTVAAASGGSAGGDAWVAAQQLISALESAHGPTVTALAEIDSLYIARIDAIAAGKEIGGADELRAAQTEIATLTETQRSQIEALKTRLSR